MGGIVLLVAAVAGGLWMARRRPLAALFLAGLVGWAVHLGLPLPLALPTRVAASAQREVTDWQRRQASGIACYVRQVNGLDTARRPNDESCP